MALKKLNQFLHFDFEAFAKGKVFQVTGCSKWVDHETKAHVGTKVDAGIVKDTTQYQLADGETVSNRFEKLTFKVPKKDMNVPVDAYVMPVNAVATVYGEYRNQLSIKADDIRILQPNR